MTHKLRCEFPQIADDCDRRNITFVRIRKFLDFDVVFSLAQQYLPECFDDFSDIDAFWTAGVAGEARCANPDGLGFQEFVPETELSITDDLIRENVHLGDSGTSRGALSALVAGEEILIA
jgi:hypothetical protein